MKKYILILMTILSSMIAIAQTETKSDSTGNDGEKMQTLFGNPGRLGWWVSPDFEWTQIDNRDAFMIGLSGGIIVKHSFSIGLAGYGIVNSQSLNYSGIVDTADVYLYGGYGGLKLEYRLFPLDMVNVGFPVLIGGGGVAYSTWRVDEWHNGNEDDEDLVAYTWDSYFVIEPGVVFGINLLKFMRFDIGASYRFAPSIDLPKTDNNILTGFNLNSSLKFGSF
jgi:hypothetical protein